MTDVVPAKMPVLLANPPIKPAIGKLSAALAAACLVAHVPLLIAHARDFPITTVAMAAVACACLPCTRRLWRSPTTHDAAMAGALAAAMLILHLYLTMTMAGMGADMAAPIPPGMHHDGTEATMSHLAAHSTGRPLHALLYVASGLASAQVALAVATVWAAAHRGTIRWRS